MDRQKQLGPNLPYGLAVLAAVFLVVHVVRVLLNGFGASTSDQIFTVVGLITPALAVVVFLGEARRRRSASTAPS